MNTDFLDPIQLQEMDKVKLMNRIDTKFWFHISMLPHLLEQIKNDYYVLTINNETNLEYTSTYFDTLNNRMFIEHHNGKLNRYKIRRRSYVSSGISFFEVKFKTNNGRTQKKRISTDFGINAISKKEDEFLKKSTPFTPAELYPSLINNFKRITLVNKNMKERCTIDMYLQFKSGDKQVLLDDLAIVEIKSDGKCNDSPLLVALREERIKSAGFSKYCVGRAITDASLKQNAFREKIKFLEKTLHINFN